MTMRLFLSAAVLGAALCGCHGARPPAQVGAIPHMTETGFIDKSIHLDGRSYPYVVYVPPDYSSRKAWPVFLFLHGKGERGSDGIAQTRVGIGTAIREHPERFPCIVVMPQCDTEHMWEGPMETLALAALDRTLVEYATDASHVVLTGLSMGGRGAWTIGARHAERFCAIVPICGWAEPETAGALTRVPIWAWHGEADPVVPVESTRKMVEGLRALGGDVRYTELPGVTHNSWDAAYGNEDLIAWMLGEQAPPN